MLTDVTKIIESDAGGTYVLFYTDDDAGSGYGENSREARWYGSLTECESLARPEAALPLGLQWHAPHRNDVDPFDLACERRWD